MQRAYFLHSLRSALEFHGVMLLVKSVEGIRIPWRNSAAVPQELPAPASGSRATLSAGLCFWMHPCPLCAARWKPFPSGRPMTLAGLSPVAELPSVPTPPAQSGDEDTLGWVPQVLPGASFPCNDCQAEKTSLLVARKDLKTVPNHRSPAHLIPTGYSRASP